MDGANWGQAVLEGAVRIAKRKFEKFGIDSSDLKVIKTIDFEYDEVDFTELEHIGLTEGALIAAVHKMEDNVNCTVPLSTRVAGMWVDVQKFVDAGEVLGHLSDQGTPPVLVERTEPEEIMTLQGRVKALADHVLKLQAMAVGGLFSSDPNDSSQVAEFKEALLLASASAAEANQ
ncbi:hypothetical protein [Stenotrophomonas maltophilia]|uniref:hypothetical protein n=1 Tax=Stenotrophomonas maltophilia TaxID=40324 RepID=UPI0021C93612|nr:hypothetical protein [Stenotrophomonas maltophilia]MCU1136952.1 hypothetical protein [Stenotrophomonas maltophilia]